MTNRIIHIISNIKATGWVTILVFSGILYYCIYSLIAGYFVARATNEMLDPTIMNNPDISEMNELITQLTLIFIGTSLISVLGIIIGQGLLRIKKWAAKGFHIFSISVGVLILIWIF